MTSYDKVIIVRAIKREQETDDREEYMILTDSQRVADGGIAAVYRAWNGLGKVGAKSVNSSNAQRDFRPLSREDV